MTSGHRKGNVAQHLEDVAQRKEEAARRKEEAARRKEEAARRKEEAARRKEEAARCKEEAARRKEEAARRKEEAARCKEERARRKEEKARLKEEKARLKVLEKQERRVRLFKIRTDEVDRKAKAVALDCDADVGAISYLRDDEDDNKKLTTMPTEMSTAICLYLSNDAPAYQLERIAGKCHGLQTSMSNMRGTLETFRSRKIESGELKCLKDDTVKMYNAVMRRVAKAEKRIESENLTLVMVSDVDTDELDEGED